MAMQEIRKKEREIEHNENSHFK